MSHRWFYFTKCAQEGFVNCFFRCEGACKNPKHRE